MGVIRVKDGVSFKDIAPGGFRILAAVDNAALALGIDLWITSACDGTHSGPEDPHKKGMAYDIRSHDLGPNKALALSLILGHLDSTRFFGFLEDPDTENEHFHVQVRKGMVYP